MRNLIKYVWLTTALLATTLSLAAQDLFPELPKLKEGAIYSQRMESVRRIAAEDEASGAVAPGSYQRVTSLLTERNLLYQTDPEGQVVACIPMIAAMIDGDATRTGSQHMQEIFDAAYKDGMEFTPKLFDIALKHGFYMDGLENAVKAASHITDKANRWLEWWRKEYNRPDATVEDVADSFYDLVRYSAITTKEKYVPATKALIQELKAYGYEITNIDNRFLDANGQQDFGKTYRAVHLTIKADERLIEIQVHDYSSQNIRNYTHEIYEKMRRLDENSDEYKQMAQQCIDAWKDYVNPEGIEEIR